MTLAFIVLAHDAPDQLAVLLRSLCHPDSRSYLHIDRRTRIAPFRSELSRAGIGEIKLLPRHASHWGGIGGVDATLDGLRRALDDGCDYFVLLSGRDLPLRPGDDLIRFFADRREVSYLEYFPLPDSRWDYDGRMRTDFYSYSLFGRRETCFPRGQEPMLSLRGSALNGLLRLWTAFKPARRFPPYARAFGGSQWWNLSRDAAEFVLRFVEQHPDYRQYHEHTLAADEIFFQSILLGTPFAEDHEIVNDSQRFMIWPPNSSHPKTLRSEDVPAMLQSGKPFARKFDLKLDRTVMEELQV